MIVLVGGIKGGSGKTTIAAHMAILSAEDGADVLLVDADDQETATDFTNLRNDSREGGAGYTCIQLAGRAVRTEIQRLAPKYDHVIIDTGGRDTASQRAALTIADIFLVPFLPRSFDVWTLDKVTALVEEMKALNPDLITYAFLNRADPRGMDNEDAVDVLSDSKALTLINTPLVSRKAYSHASAVGLAVTELRPIDRKAGDEILMLFRHIFDIK